MTFLRGNPDEREGTRAPHSHPGHTLHIQLQPPPKVRCRRRRFLHSRTVLYIRAPLAAAAAAAIATTAKGCSPIGECSEGAPLKKKEGRGRGIGRGRGASKGFKGFRHSKSTYFHFNLLIVIINLSVLHGFRHRIRKHCGRRNENGQSDCERDFQKTFSASEAGWDGEREERGAGSWGETRTQETDQKSTLGAVGDITQRQCSAEPCSDLSRSADRTHYIIVRTMHSIALASNPSCSLSPQLVGPAPRGVGEERADREEGDLRAQEVGRHVRHRRQGALRQTGQGTAHLRRPLLPRKGKRDCL